MLLSNSFFETPRLFHAAFALIGLANALLLRLLLLRLGAGARFATLGMLVFLASPCSTFVNGWVATPDDQLWTGIASALPVAIYLAVRLDVILATPPNVSATYGWTPKLIPQRWAEYLVFPLAALLRETSQHALAMVLALLPLPRSRGIPRAILIGVVVLQAAHGIVNARHVLDAGRVARNFVPPTTAAVELAEVVPVRLRLADGVAGWRFARLLQHSQGGIVPTEPGMRLVHEREFANFEVKRDGSLKAVFIDRCRSAREFAYAMKMRWLTGLEPATSGITIVGTDKATTAENSQHQVDQCVSCSG